MSSYFLDLREALVRNKHSRSSHYKSILLGLYPPPVHIGRSARWIEHEDEAVRLARIAGRSEGEIRQLVRALVAARQTDYENAVAPEGP